MYSPKSQNSNIDYQNIFPYFNNSFFVDQFESPISNDIKINRIDSQNSDESSTNVSQDSSNSLEDEEKLIPLNLLDNSPVKNKEIIEEEKDYKIKPELKKFILPKDLFYSSKNKHIEKIIEKKLEVKPYIPSKYRINSFISFNLSPFDLKLYNNTINILVKPDIDLTKKKKGFIERKGDWHCSNCKNINFAFRKECNKCKITKEESEKKTIIK